MGKCQRPRSAAARFLAVHLWLTFQETSNIHEQRATQIARGQKWA